MIEPVADFSPNFAYELCVVNHEYRLNGNPFTYQKFKFKTEPNRTESNFKSLNNSQNRENNIEKEIEKWTVS